MAKPDKPLLSLGARGTIGDALTFQKRGREYIVREKPIPKDPYSLNQAYQRWDYRDYAYLWTLLSNSEKQIYRTRASRYHITGFSQFMRESLKDLSNLVGRWRLDERSGTTAYDSSKQNNDGTIFGASPATGLVDGAYLFDGLNDYIDTETDPSIAFNDHEIWSLDLFAYPLKGNWNPICGALKATLMFHGNDDLYFVSENLNYYSIAIGTFINTWLHLLITCDALRNIRVYRDGVYKGVMVPDTSAWSSRYIGRNIWGGIWYEGRQDHIAVYDRLLDLTESIRHSQRRYPS